MSDSHYTKPSNPRFNDLSGRTFERLEVIEFAGTNSDNRALWKCKCSCGKTCTVLGKTLLNGGTRSCGCLKAEGWIERRTTHGDCGKRLYNIYKLMISRCYREKDENYENYGDRGIIIVEPWRSSYEAFREWALGHGYRDDLTIERVDVNGNYDPGNCTWIPKPDQANNTRRTRRLTAFGETKLIREWAEDPRCKVGYHTLRTRLQDGWEVEKALSTPVMTGYPRRKPRK